MVLFTAGPASSAPTRPLRPTRSDSPSTMRRTNAQKPRLQLLTRLCASVPRVARLRARGFAPHVPELPSREQEESRQRAVSFSSACPKEASSEDHGNALVAARHRDQRRARSRARRVHARGSASDRALVEAIRGRKQAAQDRAFPIRNVDADVLHQSGRGSSLLGAASPPRGRQGRASSALRQTAKAKRSHAIAPAVARARVDPEAAAPYGNRSDSGA